MPLHERRDVWCHSVFLDPSKLEWQYGMLIDSPFQICGVKCMRLRPEPITSRRENKQSVCTPIYIHCQISVGFYSKIRMLADVSLFCCYGISIATPYCKSTSFSGGLPHPSHPRVIMSTASAASSWLKESHRVWSKPYRTQPATTKIKPGQPTYWVWPRSDTMLSEKKNLKCSTGPGTWYCTFDFNW